MKERRRVEARDLIAQLVCQGFRRAKDPKMQRNAEDGAPMLAETWVMRTADGPIVVKLLHPMTPKENVNAAEK